MVDRNKLPNAFEFVTVASARAQQLLRGSVPRVQGPHKPARIAQQEVATGAVKPEGSETGPAAEAETPAVED
ncbi:MAG: DNA-directed RNA polymerase subunit omega [Vicinamibacterales bacterium]